MPRKVLVTFGTRPKANNMAPLVKAVAIGLRDFNVRVCVTARHRQMLDRAGKRVIDARGMWR